MISTNYTFIRIDRKNRAGGVFIAFKNHYQIITVRTLIKSRLIETVFVKHTINGKKNLYGCVYIPPPVNSKKLLAIDGLFNQIDAMRDSYDNVYVFGDFNVNMNTSSKLTDILSSHMYTNIIIDNTRNNSLIDLFITDSTDSVRNLIES